MANTNVATPQQSIPLWDKIINITLTTASGATETINTSPAGPGVGRKPTIRLKGKLVPSNTLLSIELRVTNLYLDQPLSNYKSIQVQAGYLSQISSAITFSGTILVAFQELPGPDGVVCFQFLLGNLDTWKGTFYSGSIAQGTMLSSVCQKLAGALNLTLVYNIVPDVPFPINYSKAGMIGPDVIPEIESLFSNTDQSGNDIGIKICPLGSQLLVYYANLGMQYQNVYPLNFITHARHNSAGFEIQAPWVPQIRPGDLIMISPQYFAQTFGGSQLPATGNLFRVLIIDFDFCTSDATNVMSLVTLAAAA